MLKYEYTNLFQVSHIHIYIYIYVLYKFINEKIIYNKIKVNGKIGNSYNFFLLK